MLVQKQVNGRVFFIENGDTVADLAAICTMNLSQKRAGIVIADEVGFTFDLQMSKLRQTQILPAAAVAAPTDITTTWTLLATSFFTELHTNTYTPTVEPRSVHIIDYVIVTTDLNLIAGADIDFTLPAVGANFNQLYRIWANGYNITITAGLGDNIIGELQQNLDLYGMVTLRAFQANNWLVGH